MDKIYAFISKAMFTETSLDSSGRKARGLSGAYLDEKVAERLPFPLLDIDLINRAKRMAVVYTAVTAFENSVRDFVSQTLLELHGENWWASKVSEKIRQKAESRRDEESKIRWHTPRGDRLLNYTEMGDLTSIINQNWADFELYLNSLEWVRNIISTVERSRNVIMHSGELGNEDIERLGTVMRDWLAQVGS